MMNIDSSNRAATGAQSIERAAAVLRAVASAGEAGAAVGDMATALRLNRTTVHRLAAALAREGLIERDAESGRCFLGRELAALGALAAARHGIQRAAAGALARLSAMTDDTAFLSIPSGYDALCVNRQEGAFPIRTQVLWPGQRHPLGVGAGSLALLAAMPDETVSEVIAANRARVAEGFPCITPDAFAGLVKQTRRRGYAVNEGMIVAGSWAIGVAITDRDGAPVAALSLAAIESRMHDPRRRKLAALLLAERDRLAGEAIDRAT